MAAGEPIAERKGAPGPSPAAPAGGGVAAGRDGQPPPPQLVLVPGLGADERMFQPQRAAFPDLLVPPWLSPRRGETLPHYAARMAEGVPRGRPLILGGISMGGMLAWEMAPHLQPAAIVLIASCRTRSGIKRRLRLLRPLWHVLPSIAFEGSKVLARLLAGRLGQAGREHRPLLVSMYCRSEAWRLRWSCRAILDWHPRPHNAAPVYHIHGAGDLVIPASRVAADRVIDGGHLINFSHAAEVNRFLGEVVAAVRRSCLPADSTDAPSQPAAADAPAAAGCRTASGRSG